MSTSCLFFKVRSVRPQLQKQIRIKEISREEHSGFFSRSPLTKKKVLTLTIDRKRQHELSRLLKGIPFRTRGSEWPTRELTTEKPSKTPTWYEFWNSLNVSLQIKFASLNGNLVIAIISKRDQTQSLSDNCIAKDIVICSDII